MNKPKRFEFRLDKETRRRLTLLSRTDELSEAAYVRRLINRDYDSRLGFTVFEKKKAVTP